MKRSMKAIVWALLNLFGFAGVVLVNGLANALPLNGKTTGQVSDQYPNLFVPAGFTFLIWGVIYLLLAAFVVYQLILALRGSEEGVRLAGRIGPLFLLSCFSNGGWIFAWHFERVGVSVLIMLVLLGSLIGIYERLRMGGGKAAASERYLVRLPFSVYLGWITIATIVNVTAFLVARGWNGFGLPDSFWTVVVVLVGILITLVVLFRRRDIPFALVVDWALVGILFKRLSYDEEPIISILIGIIAGLFLITAGILFQILQGMSRRSPADS
jgi:hypothetical protein